MIKDFNKFAVSNGVSSNTLHGYQQYTNGMISPTIIEERQMNAVTMDVFSRLMADRIIFLGTAIDSDVEALTDTHCRCRIDSCCIFCRSEVTVFNCHVMGITFI